MCILIQMPLCADRELQTKGTIRVMETLPASSGVHPHREEILAFQRAFREHIELCELCKIPESCDNLAPD